MPKSADRPLGFGDRIVAWQRVHGRNTLPWQNTRDPYRVWLSEVMLQQTQVSTVLGYYERFLHRFPDVLSLASASIGDVFALWSGLGYYSRARNLHRGAQVVATDHGGRFPETSAELMQLPGVGRSTAAAIAAFCFDERVAIFDGNVKRVLARLFAFEGDLGGARAHRELWDRATDLLPASDVGRYTQGLMDLGATVCLARDPHCLLCPAADVCIAKRNGTVDRYPIKARRIRRGAREHVWLWLAWRDRLWLTRRPEQGVWAGLWSLPEIESKAEFDTVSTGWPGKLEILATFTHVLTHFDWTLHPRRWVLPPRTARTQVDALTGRWAAGRWFTRAEALALGVPAPLRRLLSE